MPRPVIEAGIGDIIDSQFRNCSYKEVNVD